MDEHRRPVHRVLLLTERGSSVIEGLAATALVFLLLVVMVQGAFLVVVRHSAETAVAASARRATRVDTDLEEEARRLEDTLTATAPGSQVVGVSVTRSGAEALAQAELMWDPPGPRFLPIRIRVSVVSPIGAPP